MLEDKIIHYGCELWILDSDLASIFEIKNTKIKNIINSNKEFFMINELHQLDDNEVSILNKEFENNTIPKDSYILSIHGVIKIAYYIKNNISMKFVRNIEKCLLEHELFNIDNSKLQKLFDCLTDTYSYNKVKQNIIDTKNTIKNLEKELRILKNKNYEQTEKIKSLMGYLTCLIAIMSWLIMELLK